MAKQTGQITVLENNTVVNVEKQIRFIFTKNSGERITRDTSAKGVINFDIPNGDWNVSWFPVTGNQRVIPLRAGLQLKITSSTPPTALADWIYGDNTHVADPILTRWVEVLDEMKAVRDQFRDETQWIGSGKFVKESVALLEGQHGLGGYRLGEEGYDKVPFSSEITNLSRQTLTAVGSPSAQPQSITGAPVDGELYGGIVIPRGLRPCEIGVSGRGNGARLWFKGFSGPQSNEDDWREGVALGDFGVGGLSPVPDESMRDFYALPLVNAKYTVSTHWKNGPDGDATYTGIVETHVRYFRAGAEFVITFRESNEVWENVRRGGKWDGWKKYLTSANAVIDSNGNYKPASPVIQLHHNRVEYNEDFDQDNPPQFEHLETGVYCITNVREICKNGWTFNKPINGKGQPFFMIKYEQEDETTLIVRVFERTFNSKTGEFGFGEPRNIGANERWIDFHFEVDHERIAREEAQMQKEQEEFEKQERLRKEAEELAEKEAQEAYEAEIAKQEAEMLAEMEAEHEEE